MSKEDPTAPEFIRADWPVLMRVRGGSSVSWGTNDVSGSDDIPVCRPRPEALWSGGARNVEPEGIMGVCAALLNAAPCITLSLIHI